MSGIQPDPEHIHNWLRIDENITTSGQPSESELREISKLGVTRIINLGLHEHEKALPDEAGSVAALDMEYIHIPVAFDHPTKADFQKFCQEIEKDTGGKVHVHCIVNARVSVFFYRYHIENSKLDENDARVLMHRIWDPARYGETGKPWLKFISAK